MVKKLVIFLTTIVLFLSSSIQVEAALLSKTHDRVYEVQIDGSVIVTETITSQMQSARYMVPAGTEETFTIFNPLIDDADSIQKIEKTQPTIKTTVNGSEVASRQSIEGQNIKVTVSYPNNITYFAPQTIQLTYTSYMLLSQNGAIYDLYIPSFAADFEFENDTTVLTINSKIKIPKSLGALNFITPDKTPTDSGDFWQIDFNQSELTGVISWIQIGTNQYYQFQMKQAYAASTSLPLLTNTYSILLPRDMDAGSITQRVLYTSITPEPQLITTDNDGNIKAEFTVPANESGEIVINGYISLSSDPNYVLTDAGSLTDIPADLIQNYTKDADYWEVDDPLIQSTASFIKGTETDIYKIISNTYQYVVDKIDYSEVKRFGVLIPNDRQGALSTLQGGAAVCMEYSDLFIALMRAQGVPARAAFGYGFDARTTGGEDIAHQWAEVYLPKQGTWIGVDTTWGENGPAIIGGDLNHIYKYIASKDPHTPAPLEVSFLGGLSGIETEDIEISAVGSLPESGTKSAGDIVSEYSTPRTLGAYIGSIFKSISTFVQSIEDSLTSKLPESLQPIAHYLFIALPILLFLIAIVLWRFFQKRRRIERVTEEKEKKETDNLVDLHAKEGDTNKD